MTDSFPSGTEASGSGRHPRAPARETRFVSFDGQVACIALHQRPDRYRHLAAPGFGDAPRIARGAGLSYAAASFGPGVVVQEMTRFSRILRFDSASGSVQVEAGTRVGDLLAWATARNRYLPVLPGHPDITVGGCIAADVHGKNPGRDGTFREGVVALTIFHPDFGFVEASRSERRDLFDATCGGFGLTGVIVAATLALTELPAPCVRLSNRTVGSMREAADRILSSDSPFCYSWHGATAGSGAVGPGLVFGGEWCEGRTRVRRLRHRATLTAENRAGLRFCLWNRTTAAAAARVFRLENRVSGSERLLTLREASFPFEHRTVYHKFFGRRGLGEIQLMIPTASIDRCLDSLASVLALHRPIVTMVSLKSFQGRACALSPTGTGLLLAVDYVRGRDTHGFESAADCLALEFGAQPNVAKDSRLPAHIAESAIPTMRAFRERRRRFDPERRFQSELSRRLDL